MKALVAGCWLWSVAAGAAPPISAYAVPPAGWDLQPSPDGSAIAMISAAGGKPAFVIAHLDGRPAKVFATEESVPKWIYWKGPDLLVAGVLNTWRDSGNGHRVSNPRILVLSADGTRMMPVNLIYPGRFVPVAEERLISLVPDDPDHFLIATKDDYGASVSQVDVHNGHLREVQGSRMNVFRWFGDSQGLIRVALKYRNDASTDHLPVIDVLVRNNAKQDFHTLTTIKVDGTAAPDLAGLDPNDPDRILLLQIQPNGFYAIRAYSIATGKPGEIVAQRADADVGAIGRRNRLVGYETSGREQSFTYFRPEWAHDAQAIQRALGGDGIVEIVDRTDDGRHVLAALHDGALPVQYWMLDRAAGKSLLHKVLDDGSVPPASIATPKWISYKARDGMTIPALLTLPQGARPGRAVPFVVMPHDGPNAHDVLEFNWQVQFLASRGYGVLQPQFRGSTGFGVALRDAGRNEWGGAIQDDITDGTKYLVAQHIADPERIAIVGGGFGGYSALEGVIREPNLYRAAAAWAPMTDLPMLFGRPRDYAEKGMNLLMPAADPEALSAASPANTAERISAPVLIVHGKQDFTIPVQQSTTLQGAMKRAGKPVQAIYLEDADGDLDRESDRLAWLTALDRFLSANMGIVPKAD